MIQKDREKMHQDYNAWRVQRNMTDAERIEAYRGIQNAYETFTWYDSKLGFCIRKGKEGIFEATEPLFDYPARRNRRIVMKRHIMMGLFFLAVWGVVIWAII